MNLIDLDILDSKRVEQDNPVISITIDGEEIEAVRLDYLYSLSKTGHCRDCKWWKDSDGAFRRGIGAESRCPINRKEVYDGNGYCFLFEKKESEDKYKC